MTYELTIPNNQTNRRVTFAILRNFAGIEAEYVARRTAPIIRLTTDSEATWSAACAAFDDDEGEA